VHILLLIFKHAFPDIEVNRMFAS